MRKPKVQRADTRATWNALWFIAAAAVLGIVLIAAFVGSGNEPPDWLVRRLSHPGTAQGTLLAAAVIAMLPVLAMAGYLFLAGSRTVRSGRYPPPGLTAWRDTRVIEGRPAISRGRLLQGLAIALMGVSLVLPAAIWWVTRILFPAA